VGMMMDPAALVVVAAAYVDDDVAAVVVAQFPGLDAAFWSEPNDHCGDSSTTTKAATCKLYSARELVERASGMETNDSCCRLSLPEFSSHTTTTTGSVATASKRLVCDKPNLVL
jgi:hypothetical protein